MLHALVATSQPYFTTSSCHADDVEDDADPVTALPCKWKAPKKRKASNLKISYADFEKHIQYGCEKKVELEQLEGFDPRPKRHRSQVSTSKNRYLNDGRGKGLGVCCPLIHQCDNGLPASKHQSFNQKCLTSRVGIYCVQAQEESRSF